MSDSSWLCVRFPTHPRLDRYRYRYHEPRVCAKIHIGNSWVCGISCVQEEGRLVWEIRTCLTYNELPVVPCKGSNRIVGDRTFRSKTFHHRIPFTTLNSLSKSGLCTYTRGKVLYRRSNCVDTRDHNLHACWLADHKPIVCLRSESD